MTLNLWILMKANRKIVVAGLHVLGWGIILLIPRYLMHQTQFRISFMQEIAMWVPVVILFYFNYYIFIPKLLNRRKFIFYAMSLIAMIIILLFSIRLFDHYYIAIKPLPPPPSIESAHIGDTYKGDFISPLSDKDGGNLRMMRRELDIFVLCILSIAVSTSIKVTGQWYSNEKERKEMENQKLSAELSFLKSQINPHFFFNTLNSIYSLAIQKSDKTPEAIVKLSELMRYIIYESDKNLVSLKKELEYIKNYVELQQLRLMSNVKVTYDIQGVAYSDIMIEPLLFLPFIENAFKHGIDSTRKCEIKIKFVIASDRLVFIVENPIVKQSKRQSSESSGIGLVNSKKRLQLLYQDRHELKVTQTDEFFEVELAIKIGDDELHYS